MGRDRARRQRRVSFRRARAIITGRATTMSRSLLVEWWWFGAHAAGHGARAEGVVGAAQRRRGRRLASAGRRLWELSRRRARSVGQVACPFTGTAHPRGVGGEWFVSSSRARNGTRARGRGARRTVPRRCREEGETVRRRRGGSDGSASPSSAPLSTRRCPSVRRRRRRPLLVAPRRRSVRAARRGGSERVAGRVRMTSRAPLRFQ